jgi:ATP-dependent helicase Lhr and Lhr-like helicase
VSGFTGEQFALPEAVESLRTLRRSRVQASPSAEIIISGADPLNLAGIILPGDRVPAVPTNSLVFRDGVLYPSCPMREPESVKNQKSSVRAPWVSTEASTSLF